MKTEDIKKLVDKYMAGDTSIQEEDILYDYFASNDVAESLREYSRFFGFINTEVPAALSAITNKERHKTRIGEIKIEWKKVVAVAASLAIVLSGVFFLHGDYDRYDGSFIVENGVKVYDREKIEIHRQEILDAVREAELQLDIIRTPVVTSEDEIKSIVNQYLK